MEENATTAKPTVLSTGLKYGLIMAVVSIAFSMIRIALGSNPFQSDWKGWIGAVISIALVVLAHKSFKDGGDGFMSFGQGFGIGFVSILISLLVGGIFSYVYTHFVDTGILEEVWQKTADDMEAKGQSQETIDTALTWTKKLFWVFYFVFGGFFSVIIALIVSIFTQKKNPEASV